MNGFLELEARKKIFECVAKSPGIHFREIQRRVGLATGSVDYHLHFLHKNGLVRTEKVGRFLRYYITTVTYAEEDKELLSLLRQERIRHILIYLIEKRRANASKIAEALNYTPSNLSWYLKLLQEKNIIKQTKRGRFRFYSVIDKDRIIKCLVTYRSSFLDQIVDRFIEAWVME
jgi:predicted transcriptional regulator